MKKSFTFLATAFLLISFANAEDKAEELFKTKCAICHFEKVPDDKSTVIAPPAPGLIFHMHELFSSKEQIKSHMVSFSLNPSVDSAKLIGAVDRFGLMPSQKELISEEELNLVVDYMIENFGMTASEHEENQKKHNQ